MAGVLIKSTGVIETDIYLNSVLKGQIDPLNQIDVNLKDSLGNTVTPLSSTLTGNTLDVVTYGPPPVPSGVSLQFPLPSQYTSRRTGDAGWRFQNGWYDYNPPAYPAKFAQLDDTAVGVNKWYTLKNNLTVGGVSNKIRFVDVNGVQTWGAANNVNAVFIDKLTGLMFTRLEYNTAYSWQGAIDTALSYSITVNGVTYSDWYLVSLTEAMNTFKAFMTHTAWVDPAFGGIIKPVTGAAYAQTGWTADIDDWSANDSQSFGALVNGAPVKIAPMSSTYRLTFFVHKAYNLIS